MFLKLEQHTDPLDGGDARVTFETLGDRLPSFGAKSTLRHAEENGVDAVVQQSDRNQTPFDGTVVTHFKSKSVLLTLRPSAMPLIPSRPKS